MCRTVLAKYAQFLQSVSTLKREKWLLKSLWSGLKSRIHCTTHLFCHIYVQELNLFCCKGDLGSRDLCSKDILPQCSSTQRAAKSSYLCPLVFEVSLEGNVSEVAEQLVLLHPVHLRRFLFFFGMYLHLFFCCRSAQAYLSERVQQRAALIICQLDRIYYWRWKNVDVLCEGPKTKI